MTIRSATKRMWAKRWEDTHLWVSENVTSSNVALTLNPWTWIVFCAKIVIDVLIVPIRLWIQFIQQIVYTLFGVKIGRADATFCSVVVSCVIIGLAALFHSDDDIQIEHTTKAVPVNAAQMEQGEPVDPLTIKDPIARLDALIVQGRKSNDKFLAVESYLAPRIQVFDELNSSCLREEIKPYIGSSSGLMNQRLNTFTERCRKRLGTTSDNDGIQRQQETLKRILSTQ